MITINDFTLSHLTSDTFCTEVDTGCGGILPAGTPVRYAGIANSRQYFYIQDSQGWGLEYAALGTGFSL